jgi:UDP-glucose 4-epimerase
MIHRVLITGGKGFIGGHLTKSFIDDGVSVFVIDRAAAGTVVDGVDYARFNMAANPVQLYAFLNHFNPDVIVHLAAWANVREAQDAPEVLYKHNVMATANLVRAMTTLVKDGRRLSHVVFASSIAAENPVSHYGVTKLTGERMLNVFSQSTGIPVACLRFGNVYGPGQSPANGTLLATALEKALKNTPLEIFGKGQQTRDYVYVGDLTAIISTVISARIEGVHNISTGNSFTTFNVVDTFMHAYEVITGDTPTEPVYGPARPADKQHVHMPPSDAVPIDFTSLMKGIWNQIEWRLQGSWRTDDKVNWDAPMSPCGVEVKHEMATTLVEALDEWKEMYYHQLAEDELLGGADEEPPF